MRRILAVGCCALYLTFGSLAGLAHVHESADHHQESRGLHVDHGHLNNSSDHGHHHPHAHEGHGDHESGPTFRHAEHHEGDAVYLVATAMRSFDSSVSLMLAIISVGAVIDPPPAPLNLDDAVDGQPRDPPRKFSTRLRAPPA